MKYLVIGSGGRENAICAAVAKSPRVSKIYCAPGNPGTAQIAESVPLVSENVEGLFEFVQAHAIDVTVVGGESALELGIVDRFERGGVRIFGPTQDAARLETSKAFAKNFMIRHQIPTANFVVNNSAAEAIATLESGKFGDAESPVVIKADGLAAGKGVVVAPNRRDAITAIDELTDNLGGAAGRILIEECLFGPEVSLLAFASGRDYLLMPAVRDHKRLLENNLGPNTGGMGTVTDESLLDSTTLRNIEDRIVKPTLDACVSEGFPFRGVLFFGLMLTDSGPKVIEYNVRFGDPETQSILIRLATDLTEIFEAVIDSRLSEVTAAWSPTSSTTVVLAAKDYPRQPRKGDLINGVQDAAAVNGVQIFHAGTARDLGGNLVTAGGRVLNVSSVGKTLDIALASAYEAVERISWDGMQFRRDIGK